jgi:magnesium transporter
MTKNAQLEGWVREGNLQAIRDAALPLHPFTAALGLEPLKDDLLWEVLSTLPGQAASAIVAHLPLHRQVRLARNQDAGAVARILARMPVDDRVDLLQGMDNELRRTLLDHLPEEVRRQTEALAQYPDDVVGSMMIPQFVALPEGRVAGEALAELRTLRRGREPLHTLYITEASGALVGVLPLADLLTMDPALPVGKGMHPISTWVRADDLRTEAAQRVQGFDLLEIPVVNDARELVGVVTVDDIMDVVETETSDTMYQKAGVGDLTHQKDHVFSERLTQGGIAYPIRVRIGYLLVALAGGMAVGGLIEFWEDTLAAVLAAAIFIPVIMDMGGNTGTQSTTIFARGLALAHIDVRRFVPYFFREASIGVIMGLILGTIGGTFAYFWQGAPNGIPQLGLAVGIALFAVVSVAAMLGFLLPYLMVKAGLDHAPGADPFITTIKDFTGLALYFVLVANFIAPAG